MNIDSVNAELRPALAKLPRMDFSKRLFRVLGRVGPRLMVSPKTAGVSVRWVRVGNLRLRVYQPDQQTSGAALLWIHGGGFVIGSAKQDDKLCGTTAATLGIPVVSVEYRLAPESPYPAALDDALAAWEWIGAHADSLGIDPARVVVGGESAGGGIAASLVQRLRDTSDVQPVAQWLFAPMLDDRTAARHQLDAIDHPVWNNSANRFGWSSYLHAPPGKAFAPPYAVPARRRALDGLPPTWLCTGDIELFADEICEYAERLRAAGVPVEVETIPGGAHGFESWASDTGLARQAVARAHRWLEGTANLSRRE